MAPNLKNLPTKPTLKALFPKIDFRSFGCNKFMSDCLKVRRCTKNKHYKYDDLSYL